MTGVRGRSNTDQHHAVAVELQARCEWRSTPPKQLVGERVRTREPVTHVPSHSRTAQLITASPHGREGTRPPAPPSRQLGYMAPITMARWEVGRLSERCTTRGAAPT